MSSELSDGLRAGIRAARISTAMHGLSPEIANELPPEDWPEVLSQLQSTYRRVTGQPDAVLALRTPSKEGDGWQDVLAEPLADLADIKRRIVDAVRNNKSTAQLEDELDEVTAIVLKAYRTIAPPVTDTRSTGE